METYNRGEIVDVDVGLPFPVDLVDKNVPQLNVCNYISVAMLNLNGI